MSSAYTHTKLFGGQQGPRFNDIYISDNKGTYLLDDGQQDALDLTHPIQNIDVYAKNVVEGIAITYQFADKNNTILSHGSTTATGYKPNTVTLNTSEIIVGVFGRAGLQKASNLEQVNSIGFVVFDTVAETTTVYGPFGNQNGTNDGETFYVSDVIAFGGFSTDTVNNGGLSGLSFYKQFGN